MQMSDPLQVLATLMRFPLRLFNCDRIASPCSSLRRSKKNPVVSIRSSLFGPVGVCPLRDELGREKVRFLKELGIHETQLSCSKASTPKICQNHLDLCDFIQTAKV